MQAEIIKLHFKTPLHFGRGSEEMDKTELVYHSDSLKSAIYSIGIGLFEQWKDADFFFNGFNLSSCFPYSANEYFLPRPHLKQKFHFKNTPDDLTPKKSKKIEFVTKSFFENIILQKHEDLEIDEDLITPDQNFICGKSETARKCLYKSDVQQRVAIPLEGDLNEDGKGKESRPFYIDRIYFEDGCGLFFLVQFHDERLKDQILQCLKILGENGIGTDRTVGNGLFEFELLDTPIIINVNSAQNKYMPLGLYLPTESEIKETNLDNSAWSLFKRGGYMGGSNDEDKMHLRKKSIYMFGEGSVFESNIELKGKYIDLRPDWDTPIHPVWRCGMPLMLKF
jgi:CRISPR-associated protein Csm4